MVAKFLDLDNLSWQRQPFALSNDGRKVWATVLFLSAIMQRKVIHVHFFVFFLPFIQDHGFFESRSFATMATWHNHFSFLCLLPPPGKKCKIFLLNPLTIDLRVSGAPFTVTIYSLVDEPGFCNDTIADILLSALEKWCRWTMRIDTRLPLFGITISPENRAKQAQGKLSWELAATTPV